MMDSRLQMQGITLDFGPVRVLRGAELSVGSGEVHALLGENGAGKSSLMKVLFGLYRRSGGQILIDDSSVTITRPADALRCGIAMIHQELPFAGHLTLAQNLFLGREPRTRLGTIDDRRMNVEALDILERFPIEVDPRTPMRRLSLAQQQIVAVAAALSTGARYVILDEATTALTTRESEILFDLLEQLAAEGRSFIMITHRLDEVFRVATNVTVMRDGETVAAMPIAEASTQNLVRAMVGRDVADVFPDRAAERESNGPPRLSVRGLTTRKLSNVSFDLMAGEVLGVAGLMGAGRSSLFNALFGVDPLQAGTIAVDGKPASITSPADAIALGLAYVTEDRKKNGLALLRSIEENVTLPILGRHVRRGFLQRRALRSVGERFASRLAINSRTGDRAGILSGGNQQKVVLAKWLATGADVFLFDEPTRGVDVGTKMEVYELIRELTASGKSVLLVTSELPELMALSDRLLVLSDGVVVREMDGSEATPDEIVYHASISARSRT